MLQINNAKTAKKSARALEKFLAKSGVDLGHGKALDAIAVLSGFKDWNSMARATNPEAMDAQLDDFELSHIEGNHDVDYGLEHATVTHTGFELRYSAEGDVVDYVRVCDPLGRDAKKFNHRILGLPGNLCSSFFVWSGYSVVPFLSFHYHHPPWPLQGDKPFFCFRWCRLRETTS